MEGHCPTGQSPQWAVVPMEKEEEWQTIFQGGEAKYKNINKTGNARIT